MFRNFKCGQNVECKVESKLPNGCYEVSVADSQLRGLRGILSVNARQAKKVSLKLNDYIETIFLRYDEESIPHFALRDFDMEEKLRKAVFGPKDD